MKYTIDYNMLFQYDGKLLDSLVFAIQRVKATGADSKECGFTKILLNHDVLKLKEDSNEV